MAKQVKRVVLAYSGGLDTSVIIRWLKERYRCDVIAYIADLGQGEDLEAIRQKALATGAGDAIIRDLKDEFLRDFIFPMLKAQAVYERLYLMGTSIARPIIAKEQIKIARELNADAVAHGATGKGNDQVRFELSYYALCPGIKIIAPWREWEFHSREELIAYAERHNIPVPVTKEKPYSSDRNIFHISFEGGILEDPWVEPPKYMYILTTSPFDAPDTPAEIEITFEQGIPIAVNGSYMPPVPLLNELNILGGRHGIGRVDMVENRFIGIKSRGVYETPGGTILINAHRALESVAMDRELMHLRDSFIPNYSRMVYNGFWFSPEREMLQKAIDFTQKNISGVVRLKLYKGNCIITGRKANQSLYNKDLATFEKDSIFNQKDADGFIKLNALRLQTYYSTLK